jgi:hypothetical protein
LTLFARKRELYWSSEKNDFNMGFSQCQADEKRSPCIGSGRYGKGMKNVHREVRAKEKSFERIEF